MAGDNNFMRLAIEESRKSSEKLPCGVVIAQNGKVLAATYNKQHGTNDATAHAGILAIREAGRKIGSKNIQGGVMYCTCESCTMCLSAAVFAKIKRIVFGVELREVSAEDKRIAMDAKAFMEIAPRRIEIIGGYMEQECLDVTR